MRGGLGVWCVCLCLLLFGAAVAQSWTAVSPDGGRFPGREFVVVQANGANPATRLYRVRGRLYQLTVTSGAGIENQPDTRRFFDSFSLVAA